MAEIKKPVEIKKLTLSGKRKEAIAKATIYPGTGIIKVNKKPMDTFPFLRRLILSEPIKIAEDVIKDTVKTFDIDVNVTSGGAESQIEASRLAIARAILAFTKSPELKRAYITYDRSLLVADVRRKEQRKPLDSKARARRQKSYR
jgi:small subunit ribosomal protein S9